jgi:hypothetical protein
LIKNSKEPIDKYVSAPHVDYTNPDFKPKSFAEIKGFTRKIYNVGVLCNKENNIMNVDLDSYKWTKDCAFIETFGPDYIEHFNTFTQRTGSGGLHLVFEYDDDLYTAVNSKHNIDVQCSSGHFVMNGSTTYSKTHLTPTGEKLLRPYTILHNRPIMPLPADLKEWLLEHICVKKINLPKWADKVKSSIEKIRMDDNRVFSYDVSEKQLRQLVLKIGDLDLSDGKSWKLFTVACKQIDLKSAWENISREHENYDEVDNNSIWDSIIIKADTVAFEHLTARSGSSSTLAYAKYQELPQNIKAPDRTIDSGQPEYQTLNNTLKYPGKLGHKLLIEGENLVIKSDTGTGKTTSFKHYIKSQQFVSIVSRVSLADEQHQVFCEHGIECKHYDKDMDFLNLHGNESIVITVDSLITKLSSFDYSNCVLFLDEFNSLVEYVLSSETLDNKRCEVLKSLVEALQSAQQIICCDADISDLSLNLLDECGLDYTYIENTYNHNASKKAIEFYSYESITADIQTQDKFIVCMDSAKQANKLWIDLGKDPKILLITADTTEYHNLDDYDRIIYSPKIVYGLDSTMERKVYCIFKGQSISPAGMVQQVNRCRNIVDLSYYFDGQSKLLMGFGTGITKSQCESRISKRQELSVKRFETRGFNSDFAELFAKLYGDYLYKQYCYETNKFKHFRNIIERRGFTLLTPRVESESIDNTQTNKVVAEYKNSIFVPKEHLDARLNQILRMDKPQIDLYRELFIDNHVPKKHFAACDIWVKDTEEQAQLFPKLLDTADFDEMKIQSLRSQIVFLNEFKVRVKCSIGEDNVISCDGCLTKEESAEFQKQYRTIFRYQGKRSVEADYTTPYKCVQQIVKMSKALCDTPKTKLIISKKVRVDKKTQTQYRIDTDVLQYHRDILTIRAGEVLEPIPQTLYGWVDWDVNATRESIQYPIQRVWFNLGFKPMYVSDSMIDFKDSVIHEMKYNRARQRTCEEEAEMRYWLRTIEM